MENHLVRKSNFLIEASYKLTLVEQRLIMVLASMIRPADVEFKKYRLKVKSFADLLAIKHKDGYAQVKEITRKLLTRAFTIKQPDGTLQIGWLSSAKYLDGKGVVELCFDPQLKPFLLQLKERFTSFRLKNIIQLKSSFSIRIYELLKQYEKIGERTFQVEALRELLGIGEDQYKLYGDFKRKVLLLAQRELEEKTDIQYSFEEIKVGRSVGKIRFIINIKPLIENLSQELDPILLSSVPEKSINDPDSEALEKLQALIPEEFRDKKTVQSLLVEFLKNHDFDYVARNIKYTNASSNAVKPGIKPGKGSNYRNYLQKALRCDYGLPFEEDLEGKKENEEKARQLDKAKTLAVRQENEKIEQDLKNKERARIFRESLAPEALDTLRIEALNSLSPQEQEHIARKAPGSELLLKMALDKICLERIRVN